MRNGVKFDLSFLALLALAYYAWPLLIPGMDLLGGDALLLSAPTRQLFVDNVRQGVIPLWNPYVGCGVPALAAWQSAYLYPLHLLLLLISPVPYASRVILFLHYLLQAFGMYGLARHGLRIRREAGLFAGAALSLCAFNAAKAEQFVIVAAAAWAPLLLWAWVVWMRRLTTPPLIAFSLCLTMALLAGHPQLLVYTLYSILLLTLIPPIPTRVRAWKASLRWRCARLAGLAPALALAGLLCAAQLLPTLELIPHSMRTKSLPGYGSGWSLPPRLLLQFIAPGMLHSSKGVFPQEEDPAEMAAFVGRATIALALLAVTLSWRTPLVRSLLCLTTAIVILALGKHGPMAGFLFRVADSHLPGWSGLRVPARLLYVADICLALLAAQGLHWIARGIGRGAATSPASDVRRGLAFILGMALCVLCALEEYPVSENLTLRQAKAFDPPTPSTSLPGFFESRPGLYRTFTLITRLDWRRNDPAAATARIAAMEPNSGAGAHIAGIEAYEEGLLPLIRTKDFLIGWWSNLWTDRPDARILGMLSVRYVASEGRVHGDDWVPAGILDPAEAGERAIGIFENRRWLPMVAWAGQFEAVGDLRALDGQYIFTGEATPAPATRRPLPAGGPASAVPAADRIGIERLSANRLEIEKDGSAEADMIFATSAYPGWIARWKGGSQPLSAVNAIHLRFHAPAGVNRIALTFEPFSFRLGLFLSLTGLSLLALWGALTMPRRV